MALRLKTRDDEGSMAVAMLLTMVAAMFAAMLVPLVVNQIGTTKVDTRRNQSFDAAQAGLDVMLGTIRDANDGSGDAHPAGDLAKLPCYSEKNPLSGTIPGTSQQYDAWVYYFKDNPRGHDNWLDDPSSQIRCFGAKGTGVTPGYAVMVSRGRATEDSDKPRTIQATYVFKALNTNVPGGLIHEYKSSPDLCLDAGTSAPTAGTVPTMQRCQSGRAAQMWWFKPNNTVVLASTVDSVNGDPGLCLDAPYTRGGYGRNNNDVVKLQTCSSLTTPRQQWGFQGTYPLTFIATNSDGTQPDIFNDSSNVGACWKPSTLGVVGANLVLDKCKDNGVPGFDQRNQLVYDSAVGAGNASSVVQEGGGYRNPLGFLNNYGQFGRCLDVTLGRVPQLATVRYMIAYFCRSSPDPNLYPKDAQLWTTPTIPATATSSAAGFIRLKYNVPPAGQPSSDRTNYCLTSPGYDGGYPRLDPCNGSNSAQKWVMWGDTGDYTSSYRITDNNGMCLQPSSTAVSPDVAGGIYKIIVTGCSSDTLQKWNAPPGVVPFPVTDYRER